MRYVTRKQPHAWFDDGELHDTRTVQSLGQPYVYDDGPRHTGLLDKNGNTIMRIPDECGFYEKDLKPKSSQ